MYKTKFQKPQSLKIEIKTISADKNKAGELPLPNFKTYYITQDGVVLALD